MNKAVFLDRDNTLIHNDGDLGDPSQVRLMRGVASAIASLRGLGFKIVIVTNQGGVARGCYGEKDVDAVHHRIVELVKENAGVGAVIDRFYYCPYHPEGTVQQYRREHPWRKPSPGMLTQAAEDLDLDLESSWMVGDQLRDIEAGAAVGTRTVLLHNPGVDDEPPQAVPTGDVEPDYVAASLIEAARIIAQHRHRHVELTPPVTSPPAASSGTEVAESERAAEASAPNVPQRESASPRSGSAAASPRKSTRPFVPWDVQPDTPRPSAEEAKVPASPTQQPPSQEEQALLEFEQQVTETVAEEPGESDARIDPEAELEAASTPEPDETPTNASAPATAPRETQAVEAHSTKPSEDTPAAVSEVEPAVGAIDEKPSVVTDDGLDGSRDLLVQILRELKSHRADFGDFSLVRMSAGVMQMVALGCAGFGLMKLAEPAAFLQWFSGAILSQLMVMTLLLADAKK